jgi:hypothetical protein
MNLLPMSSMTAGWLLSGSSSQWKGARPGKVFEALVEGEYANPVIVVDEIDKASGDAQYDPLGALYSLLEHDTAQSFTDEFAEVAIDASQVIWITTANDSRGIPDPILNRMNVFEVQAPTARSGTQHCPDALPPASAPPRLGPADRPRAAGRRAGLPVPHASARNAPGADGGLWQCAAGPPRHRRSGRPAQGAPPAAAASVSCSSGCRAPHRSQPDWAGRYTRSTGVPQATLCPFP